MLRLSRETRASQYCKAGRFVPRPGKSSQPSQWADLADKQRSEPRRHAYTGENVVI